MSPDSASAAPNVFVAALQWLQGTLLGELATAVAVIAVAVVGLLLLSGRIDVRRSVQVIFGCFILFGASTIAAGLTAIVSGADGTSKAPPPPAALSSYAPVPAQAARPASPYGPKLEPLSVRN